VTEDEIYPALNDIFNEIFQRRDIVLKPELTAADIPGWNSFKYIDIIMAAEERFAIRLETDEIDGLENIGDLAALIAANLPMV
jgi:acyl carrier protein